MHQSYNQVHRTFQDSLKPERSVIESAVKTFGTSNRKAMTLYDKTGKLISLPKTNTHLFKGK